MERGHAKACLIGGGIATLASAAYLIKEAGLKASNIRIAHLGPEGLLRLLQDDHDRKRTSRAALASAAMAVERVFRMRPRGAAKKCHEKVKAGAATTYWGYDAFRR